MFSLKSKLSRLPYVVYSIVTFLLSISVFIGAIIVPVYLSGIDFDDPNAADLLVHKILENLVGLGLAVLSVRVVYTILTVIQAIATVRRVNDITDGNLKISLLVGGVFLLCALTIGIISEVGYLAFIISLVLWFVPGAKKNKSF